MATEIRNHSTLARAGGPNGHHPNGNGRAAPAAAAAPAVQSARLQESPDLLAAPRELAARDWLRAAEIARVMGLLGLYLFLEN